MEGDTGQAGGRHRSALAVGAVVVGTALLVGMAAYDHFRGPRSKPLSAFPERVATTDMRAREIEALMSGMRIEGVRRLDRQPFTIVLKPDRTADYSFAQPGASDGATIHLTGKWRVENARFCLQVPRFAKGQEVCPRIVKDGDRLEARRGDGTVIPWSLSK